MPVVGGRLPRLLILRKGRPSNYDRCEETPGHTEPKREGEFLKEMRLRDWPSSPGMVSYQKRHMGKYSDKITDSNRG